MAKSKPGNKKNDSYKKKWKKFFLAFLFLIVALGVAFVYNTYKKINNPNVNLENKEPYLYIRTGYSFEDVKQKLVQNNLIIDIASFEWLAKQKNYINKVKPGKYKLENGMNNNDLINLLRSGKQETVKITINNIRTKKELVSLVCKQLEADSLELLSLLENDHELAKLNYNSDNIISIFLPNTYDFYWNTSAKKFFNKMLNESDKFWTKERISKLNALKLSKAETITIASIVEKETNYNPEKPSIASVYLNRFKKGMKLQADPTVVFANNDFEIKRVLEKHLQKDSPYNTYMYQGLPPGPICIPSQSSIDAVLENKKTNFIYFCAKEDFSGKHNFASNERDHINNANKFRRALNNRGIYH